MRYLKYKYSIIYALIAIIMAPHSAYSFNENDRIRLFETRKCLFCDLRDIEFKHRNFNNVDISGSDLSGATIIGSHFKEATMLDVKFEGATIKDSFFNNATLNNAIFRNSKIIETKFNHAVLVDSDYAKADLQTIDFSNANMSNNNFNGINIWNTKFNKANLTKVYSNNSTIMGDFSGSDLTDACFVKSIFFNTKFDGNTTLENSSFIDSIFQLGNFKNAVLKYTDFTNTEFYGSWFIKTYFLWTNLTGVYIGNLESSGEWGPIHSWHTTSISSLDSDNIVSYSTIADSIFEPKHLPSTMISVKGLSTLTWANDPSALTKLRTKYRDLGLRQQERQITYALKIKENQTELGWLDKTLNYVFEYTSDYGWKPWKALVWLLKLYIIFTIFYFIYIFTYKDKDPTKKTGIWKIWPTGCIENNKENSKLIIDNSRGVINKFKITLVWSLWFSFLSSTHFGWRNINSKAWVSRLTPFEYELKAIGIVKTISGLQSLISVLLIAIWLITQFGRPFQ